MALGNVSESGPNEVKLKQVDDGHSHEVSGGTITAAVFGIVKAMVGPAILYLPHSFADAGYAFAIIALWICTILYLHTSNRLLATWRYVREERELKRGEESDPKSEIEMASLVNDSKKIKRRNTASSKDDDSYSDHGSLIEKEDTINNDAISYPRLARLAYGEVGENVVRAGITMMQLGVCLTYFIFVPHNLSASVQSLTGIELPLWLCLVGMVILEIPLSSIRNVRKLVTTNIIATCLIAFGLASCLYLATFGKGGDNLGHVALDVNHTLQGPTEDILGEELENQVLYNQHLSPWNDHWYLFIGTSVSPKNA
jgi:proton-coupled amino acid transporter